MSRVSDIESRIRQLSPDELVAFRRWFEEFDSGIWDRRIEEDARTGRLDSLADEALEEHRRGESSEL